MNPLLSRTGRIVAVLMTTALIAFYFYLRFAGWSHPVAKSIGVYKHRVATLGDFVRYQGNPNVFFSEDSAAILSFDCERIREDFVKLTQSIVSPELSTSSETMVWREGDILHLTDHSVSGSEAFAAWKMQVTRLATTGRPEEAGHYGSLLQSLFTSVKIHGRNAGEDFSVETKGSGRLDACR